MKVLGNYEFGRLLGGAFAALAIVALPLALTPPARAAEAAPAWRVSAIFGKAQFRQGDEQWHALRAGATLEPGTTIETSADARVVLKSAKDIVTVSPNSRLSVPAKKIPGKGANFLESLGTILFDIEHNPSRHFEVDTPYLAAVVKGTVFTVTIGRDGGAVQVVRGAVQVASSLSSDLALVRLGQIARVPAGPGSRMTITEHGHTMLAPRTGKSKAELQEPDYGPSNAATKSHGLGRTLKAAVTGADDGALVLTHGLGEQKIDVVKATHGFVTATSAPPVGLPSAGAAGLGSQAPNAINNGNGNALGNANGNGVGIGDVAGNSVAASAPSVSTPAATLPSVTPPSVTPSPTPSLPSVATVVHGLGNSHGHDQ